MSRNDSANTVYAKTYWERTAGNETQSGDDRIQLTILQVILARHYSPLEDNAYFGDNLFIGETSK